MTTYAISQHPSPITRLTVRQRAPALAAKLVMAAAAGLLALGSQAQESPQDGVYKDRIDWGLLMDLSGPTSASQGVWVNGFQDYMRRINEAGGINGRKINVLAEDNRFNAATDKIAFEKLVGQTPVIAISGMGSSGSQVGLAPTIKAGKVPIVGTYTATKALSEPVTPMVYNGFCGYQQMAQAGVGYYVDNLKLKAILQRELGRDLPLDDPRLIQHSGKIEQLAAYGLRAEA